jgi:hypothetical protein
MPPTGGRLSFPWLVFRGTAEDIFPEGERPREPHPVPRRPGTAALQWLIEAVDGTDTIPPCRALSK